MGIRATKTIGAIMTTLEIMLTRASPLAVEPKVHELEWTINPLAGWTFKIKIKLLAI